jgi:hypothetical protein
MSNMGSEGEVSAPESLVAFRSTYPNCQHLVEGLEFLPRTEQIKTLVSRMVAEDRFKWVGRNAPPETHLEAGGKSEGDCGTISRAFTQIALALGFDDAKTIEYPGPMYVADGGKVLGGLEGNVDGTTDWYFEKHFTGYAGGTEYDLLFYGKEGAMAYVKGEDASFEESGVKIVAYDFGSVTLYMNDPHDWSRRYTKDKKLALERAGATEKWSSERFEETKKATAMPKDQRIGQPDRETQKSGVLLYLTDFPSEVQEPLAEWMLSNLSFPLLDSEDMPIYDLLDTFMEGKGFTAKFSPKKWNEWGQDKGMPKLKVPVFEKK